MMNRCPGQDTRYWKPEDVYDVRCPVCETPVEFLKTDRRRTCSNCGYRFRNPHIEISCAQWCEHGEECLGHVPGEEPRGLIQGPIAEQLVDAIKEEFGDDYARVAQALRVLKQAQALLQTEDGDPKTVTAAAILHDVGPEHDTQASARARHMMEQTGLESKVVEQVCGIVCTLHGGAEIDTPEFRIVHDARRLATLSTEDERKQRVSGETIADRFMTPTGAAMARQIVTA